MGAILDTQIISYQFKGQTLDLPQGAHAISSITANEFLLAQPRNDTRPDYYVLHPAIYKHLSQAEEGFFADDHLSNPKWAKRGDRRTDHVVIDFGNQFPPYREFGNEAIATIINEGLQNLYRMSTLHLPKKQQKYLKERFNFILAEKLNCVPIGSSSIELGMDLFSLFVTEFACKGNIRNTINDVLILATAIDTRSELVSKDSVLNRFAASIYGGKVTAIGESLRIDFTDKDESKRQVSRESKGFVNRGWSYAIRRGNAVQGT